MSQDQAPYQYDHALTGDEFLSSNDVVIEKVPTPEIKQGSYICVRSLDATARGQIDDGAAQFKEGRNKNFAREFSVKLVFLGACDAQGNRLFTKEEHVVALKKKNSAVISRLAARISALSGLSKQDVEMLEKNLPETQPEDLPID